MYSKLKPGDKVEVIQRLNDNTYLHTVGIVIATTLSTIRVTYQNYARGNYTGRLYETHTIKTFYKKNGRNKYSDSKLGIILKENN